MTSEKSFHITVNVPDNQWATEAGTATLCGSKSAKLLRYQFAEQFMKVKNMVPKVCPECLEKYQAAQAKN